MDLDGKRRIEDAFFFASPEMSENSIQEVRSKFRREYNFFAF